MTGFALGIQYLTGYAIASDPASRERAEWPLHPGRVFMALAAAYFETGEDPREREALEWLESLEPPLLSVSEADHRSVVTCFVPVNDKARPSKAPLQSAPGITRDRAGRTFPRARPLHDMVYLVWGDVTPSPAHRDALAEICRKVIRIGHSSSLVQVWYVNAVEDIQPSLAPANDGAELTLRRVGRGTLEYLRQQYNGDAVETFARLAETITTSMGKVQREAKADFERATGQTWKKGLAPPRSRRPVLSLWQGYRWLRAHNGERPVGTVFDPSLLVVRLEPVESRFERLDLVATLRITNALRRKIQAVVGKDLEVDPIPSVVSGHRTSGQPAESPHAAYLPLAFVGRPHATGHLLGLAVALPREEHWPEHGAQHRIVMAAVARVTELTLGALGIWQVIPEVRETPHYTLLPETWTAFPGGERVWASVTPVAFDEHPKEKDRAAYLEAVAAMVRQACMRIGLPEPVAVQVTPVSKHLGAPPAREFSRLRRKDGGERRHTHVVLEFSTPVVGPVLIGAGRYRGYGVCRPVRESGGSA